MEQVEPAIRPICGDFQTDKFGEYMRASVFNQGMVYDSEGPILRFDLCTL
jgi:hypothetical protein